MTAIEWTRNVVLTPQIPVLLQVEHTWRRAIVLRRTPRAQMLTVSLPSAVRQVNELELSAAPPLAGLFLRLRVTIFSGLLRPGLSDYERPRPEVLEKNINPLWGPRMCSGEKIKGEFLPSASTTVRAKLLQVHSRFAVD